MPIDSHMTGCCNVAAWACQGATSHSGGLSLLGPTLQRPLCPATGMVVTQQTTRKGPGHTGQEQNTRGEKGVRPRATSKAPLQSATEPRPCLGSSVEPHAPTSTSACQPACRSPHVHDL